MKITWVPRIERGDSIPESTLWGCAVWGPWKKHKLRYEKLKQQSAHKCEPVCPMAAVRPLVWSRWHAGPSTAPPPAAALAASSKGSRCCSAVAAVGQLPGGSLWCREFGKPRLTPRYPPYPEMAQNLPITFKVLFLLPSTLTRNCPLFPEMMQLYCTLYFWPKSAIFAEGSVKIRTGTQVHPLSTLIFKLLIFFLHFRKWEFKLKNSNNYIYSSSRLPVKIFSNWKIVENWLSTKPLDV